jgi:hypothetical protein
MTLTAISYSSTIRTNLHPQGLLRVGIVIIERRRRVDFFGTVF